MFHRDPHIWSQCKRPTTFEFRGKITLQSTLVDLSPAPPSLQFKWDTQNLPSALCVRCVLCNNVAPVAGVYHMLK